jgi:hypothetical protein
LILVLALTDDEFQRDLENEFDDSQSIRASLTVVGAAARVAGHLIG